MASAGFVLRLLVSSCVCFGHDLEQQVNIPGNRIRGVIEVDDRGPQKHAEAYLHVPGVRPLVALLRLDGPNLQ